MTKPDLKKLLQTYIGLKATEPTSRTQVISVDELLNEAMELTGIDQITQVYGVALLWLIQSLQEAQDE